MFSQGLSVDAINLPDLELSTSNDFLGQTSLLCDFPSGYFKVLGGLSRIGFYTDKSNYIFDEELVVQSTWYYSDINLKENVTKMKDDGSSMEKILKLEGIKYNLKDDKDKLNLVGFSAQDLQKVLPDLVSADEEGTLAVNYPGLIPYLVEALKEQENRISKLEAMLIELGKLETQK